MARAPIPIDTTPPSGRGISGSKTGTALAVGIAIWLLAAAGFALTTDFGSMERATISLLAAVFFMPAALVSGVLYLIRAAADLRSETVQLQRLCDELRRVISEQKHDTLPLSPVAQSRIDALSSAQEETESRLTLFFSHRAHDGGAEPRSATSAGSDDAQPLLALGGMAQAQADAPTAAELIRALHFPEDENDTDGFDALRKALSDTRSAPLVRAAQDVLTRLAQEGIYMDDLRPDRARPEFWRAFANGTRGALIAPLGGIRDRSCLALTSGRMRSDPDFRQAVHLFLREFDKVFSEFEKQADDAQIVAMSDTRSARAFMLLGRVSGIFSR
ncbi:hypothetical protein [Roseinatronobacter alkalisoli]|uniref:Uncharacterized protein n=1 Tax=Roseinatronobacter alkalisoli TaxID=3028235 RepID=A0ABT5T9M4_9RHOB|nr:hypothetical protein [Roseinatronobacter sp. HJB301]MDD7971813.1 hypothetical protein [Roseinatronobacter sp. HJB301]